MVGRHNRGDVMAGEGGGGRNGREGRGGRGGMGRGGLRQPTTKRGKASREECVVDAAAQTLPPSARDTAR